MAKIEDVTGEEEAQHSAGPSSTLELQKVLRQVSAKLALPEELLPTFLNEDKPSDALQVYRDHAFEMLRQISSYARSSAWSTLDVHDHAEVMFQVSRLYGFDPWTDGAIRAVIEEISHTIDAPKIAIHILSTSLRQLFSAPHPMLSDSSRALSRPVGGPDAQLDFQDAASQLWKTQAGWGSHNVLAWCCAHLSSMEIQDHIGVILPPTLTLMDDWESPWRGRGVAALGIWVDKVDPGWMKRMRMDKLILDSMVQTLSLHQVALPHVLPTTMRLLDRVTDGAGRAKRLEEIMDKGIIQGWMYAKSGSEGRPVLIQIAKDLETLCEEMGSGIVRWLKNIIPNLLQPLQFSPTDPVLPHFQANLRCLLKVMVTTRNTGRIGPSRGKILHILSILWVQLSERGLPDGPKSPEEDQTRDLIIQIVKELSLQCPSIVHDELAQLSALDSRAFNTLMSCVT